MVGRECIIFSLFVVLLPAKAEVSVSGTAHV